MGDTDSFLGRLGRNIGFAVGAGALAAMLLSTATSEARPRRHYAQNQVNGNGHTLNSREACAYETVKAELSRQDVTEDIAPYVMAIINKETRFSPRKTCPETVRYRLEKILESIKWFDGLICPGAKGPRSPDDDLEAGIGAYLRPRFAEKAGDSCAAYDTLRRTGSSMRRAAEAYRQKIAGYEGNKCGMQKPADDVKKEEIKVKVAEIPVEKPKPVEQKPIEELKSVEQKPKYEHKPEPVKAAPEPVPDVKQETAAPEKADEGFEVSKPVMKSVDDIIDVPMEPVKNKDNPQKEPIKHNAYAKETNDLEGKIEAEAVAGADAGVKIEAEAIVPEKAGIEKKAEADVADKVNSAVAETAKDAVEIPKPKRSTYIRPRKCRGLRYSSIDGKLYLRVKVRPNDSPWNIANNYTRSALNYKKIRRRNGTSIDDKSPLQPGERIYIPTNILKGKYRDSRCFPKNHQSRLNKKRRKNYSARVYRRR